MRPWGFWKPIEEKILKENPDFKKNKDFKLDMFNVFIGIIAQTALVILPMYMVFRQQLPTVILVVVLIICGYLLKKYWWDKLEEKLD